MFYNVVANRRQPNLYIMIWRGRGRTAPNMFSLYVYGNYQFSEKIICVRGDRSTHHSRRKCNGHCVVYLRAERSLYVRAEWDVVFSLDEKGLLVSTTHQPLVPLVIRAAFLACCPCYCRMIIRRVKPRFTYALESINNQNYL